MSRSRAPISRLAADNAVADARTKWKRADEEPTEKNVRAAFRACVLAARLERRASESEGHEESELADKLEIESRQLRGKLARIAEGAEPLARA